MEKVEPLGHDLYTYKLLEKYCRIDKRRRTIEHRTVITVDCARKVVQHRRYMEMCFKSPCHQDNRNAKIKGSDTWVIIRRGGQTKGGLSN